MEFKGNTLQNLLKQKYNVLKPASAVDEQEHSKEMQHLTQHLHSLFQTPSPQSICATHYASAAWKNLQIHRSWLNWRLSYKMFQNPYTSTELKKSACIRDRVALLPKNLQNSRNTHTHCLAKKI